MKVYPSNGKSDQPSQHMEKGPPQKKLYCEKVLYQLVWNLVLTKSISMEPCRCRSAAIPRCFIRSRLKFGKVDNVGTLSLPTRPFYTTENTGHIGCYIHQKCFISAERSLLVFIRVLLTIHMCTDYPTISILHLTPCHYVRESLKLVSHLFAVTKANGHAWVSTDSSTKVKSEK